MDKPFLQIQQAHETLLWTVFWNRESLKLKKVFFNSLRMGVVFIRVSINLFLDFSVS